MNNPPAPGELHTPHRGFTLIEVLVALVIVAVGMSALMGALTSSANSVLYLRDKTFAEWVALNQIANTRLQLQQGQLPPAGKTEGDLDYGSRSWHWRQDVAVTPVQGIVRLDVKVRPAEIKGNDDTGWYVTVSGLAGDSVASPGSGLIPWDSAAGGPGGQPDGNNGKPLDGGTPNDGTGTGGSGGAGTPHAPPNNTPPPETVNP